MGMNWAKQLRTAAKQRLQADQISAAELARTLGVNENRLRGFLAGDRDTIQLDLAEPLGRYLGFDLVNTSPAPTGRPAAAARSARSRPRTLR